MTRGTRRRDGSLGSPSRKIDLDKVMQAGTAAGIARYLSRSKVSRFFRLFNGIDAKKDVALACVTLSIWIFGKNKTGEKVSEKAIDDIHNGNWEPWQQRWHADLVDQGIIGTRYE